MCLDVYKTLILLYLCLISCDLVHGLNSFLPKTLNTDYVGVVEVHVKEETNRFRRSTDGVSVPSENIDLSLIVNDHPVDIHLHRNNEIQDNVPVYTMGNNGVVSPEYVPHQNNAFYYQSVQHSAAFFIETNDISSCIFGSFRDINEEYFLEPKEQDCNYTSSTSPVFRLLKIKFPRFEYADKVLSSPSEESIYSLKNEDFHRVKRQTPAYQIEMLLIVDYSIYSYWFAESNASTTALQDQDAKANIRRFYAWVITGMDVRYKNIQTSDYTISIVYGGIYIADAENKAPFTENIKNTATTPNQVDVTTALNDVTSWVKSTSGLPDHDHAMMFSRYDFTKSGSTSNAGLAWVGQVCRTNSVSIVEDHFDFVILTVAAHELGHSLNAAHDGTGNACNENDAFIMAPSSGPIDGTTNPWKFSTCSTTYFTTYINQLNSENNNCMTTLSASFDPTALAQYNNTLPGEVYDADAQCRHIMGSGSSLCKWSYNSNFSSICSSLWCHKTDGSGQCQANVGSDGLLCGNKKWCISGVCTYDERAPEGDESCLYGDRTGVVITFNGVGKTCSEQDILGTTAICYQSSVNTGCCKQCAKVYTGRTGCEYGDKANGCTLSHCPSHPDVCCGTCYTPTTTITVPTTTTSTTASTTTTTPVPTTTSTVPITTTSPSTTTTIPTTVHTTTTTDPTTTSDPTTTITDSTTTTTELTTDQMTTSTDQTTRTFDPSVTSTDPATTADQTMTTTYSRVDTDSTTASTSTTPFPTTTSTAQITTSFLSTTTTIPTTVHETTTSDLTTTTDQTTTTTDSTTTTAESTTISTDQMMTSTDETTTTFDPSMTTTDTATSTDQAMTTADSTTTTTDSTTTTFDMTSATPDKTTTTTDATLTFDSTTTAFPASTDSKTTSSITTRTTSKSTTTVFNPPTKTTDLSSTVTDPTMPTTDSRTTFNDQTTNTYEPTTTTDLTTTATNPTTIFSDSTTTTTVSTATSTVPTMTSIDSTSSTTVPTTTNSIPITTSPNTTSTSSEIVNFTTAPSTITTVDINTTTVSATGSPVPSNSPSYSTYLSTHTMSSEPITYTIKENITMTTDSRISTEKETTKYTTVSQASDQPSSLTTTEQTLFTTDLTQVITTVDATKSTTELTPSTQYKSTSTLSSSSVSTNDPLTTRTTSQSTFTTSITIPSSSTKAGEISTTVEATTVEKKTTTDEKTSTTSSRETPNQTKTTSLTTVEETSETDKTTQPTTEEMTLSTAGITSTKSVTAPQTTIETTTFIADTTSRISETTPTTVETTSVSTEITTKVSETTLTTLSTIDTTSKKDETTQTTTAERTSTPSKITSTIAEITTPEKTSVIAGTTSSITETTSTTTETSPIVDTTQTASTGKTSAITDISTTSSTITESTSSGTTLSSTVAAVSTTSKSSTVPSTADPSIQTSTSTISTTAQTTSTATSSSTAVPSTTLASTTTTTIPTTTTTITTGKERRFIFIFTLVIIITQDLSDSSQYAIVVINAQIALTRLYRRRLGSRFRRCRVRGVRRGSLVIDHEVFTEDVPAASSEIVSVAKDLYSGKDNITYDGKEANVSAVTYTDTSGNNITVNTETSACQIFEASGSCSSGYKCIETTSGPACGPVTDEYEIQKMIIIGAAVGGVSLICIIAIVLVLCLCCKKSDKKKSRATGDGPYGIVNPAMDEHYYNKARLNYSTESDKSIYFDNESRGTGSPFYGRRWYPEYNDNLINGSWRNQPMHSVKYSIPRPKY